MLKKERSFWLWFHIVFFRNGFFSANLLTYPISICSFQFPFLALFLAMKGPAPPRNAPGEESWNMPEHFKFFSIWFLHPFIWTSHLSQLETLDRNMKTFPTFTIFLLFLKSVKKKNRPHLYYILIWVFFSAPTIYITVFVSIGKEL